MKMLRIAVAVALLFAATPAFAQWQTPNYSVPIGKGSGYTGFDNVAPGVSGKPLVSTGPTSKPAFGNIANSGFAAGPADTYKGSLDGTTVVDVPRAPCTAVSQALRYTAGVGEVCGNVLNTTGFDMPINMGLSASAVGGALTVNVTQSNGSAATSSSPVLVPFRSTTATSGAVTWSTISSALSLTVPSGATLGTSNGTSFRVWLFLGYNGGTPEIGVATCSNATSIFPCASWESLLVTSTTISAGATSAGTLYAGTGVTLDAVRIIGYCDFANGLATAGTWASACTALQVFGPGIKKPGEQVQRITTTLGTLASGTTAIPDDNTIPQISEGDQYLSQAITPSSSMNLLTIDSKLNVSSTSVVTLTAALFRDATANAIAAGSNYATGLANVQNAINISALLLAAQSTSTTFTIRAGGSAGTLYVNGRNATQYLGGVLYSYMTITEIQG